MNGQDIVVVGASAGGIDALAGLVRLLPADLPATVFIVTHHSHAEALAAVSLLPVHPAADLQRFQPGNIYVCPADRHLSIENGIMRVEESPKEGSLRPNIDLFFRSASAAYGRRVVGVILTGWANDGTAGLWQIKKRGGVAIVQDPNDATFPDMPQSAIDNVAVDYVLSIEDIARKIVELAPDRHAKAKPKKVLIVEDELLVASNMKSGLEEFGYEISGTARSGESAFNIAAEKNPDVVLMDIRLVGTISGVEAARRIWERFQTPIVYVTAHTDHETLNAVRTTENYGYVVKPFQTEAIHAAIQLALYRREKETRHI